MNFPTELALVNYVALTRYPAASAACASAAGRFIPKLQAEKNGSGPIFKMSHPGYTGIMGRILYTNPKPSSTVLAGLTSIGLSSPQSMIFLWRVMKTNAF
jgi:hypothetical protein